MTTRDLLCNTGKYTQYFVITYRDKGTFLVAQLVKNLPAMQETSGRPPGEGNGDPLQYSCLENPHGQKSLMSYSPWGLRVRQD